MLQTLARALRTILFTGSKINTAKARRRNRREKLKLCIYYTNSDLRKEGEAYIYEPCLVRYYRRKGYEVEQKPYPFRPSSGRRWRVS